MKLFWLLSHFDLTFPLDVYQIPKPIGIETNDQLRLADFLKDLDANKNAYQRSRFWEISQKSDKTSEINEGSDVLYPKSMLKELARQGVDISHIEYSRPPGGHQSITERGINIGYQKWEETIVHPDTGKDVIVIPFTFEESFPEKDIIRGYLMDMNLGKFLYRLLAFPLDQFFVLACHLEILIRYILFILAGDSTRIYIRIWIQKWNCHHK